MRVTVVKPSWRIRGGFEIVLDAVERDLSRAGHDVRRLELDVPSLPRAPFGVSVPQETWDRAPEWFNHLAMLERFRRFDVSGADLVLSTQPPSYAAGGPRHLALFYHHARAFYDLEDAWIRAGFAPEPVHASAAAMLRDAEAADLAAVSHFLAGSERVAERLRHFQGPDVSASVYHAATVELPEAGEERFEQVLCVSRHEFPKRTELAVLALALTRDTTGVLVGSGGRMPFVEALAADLAAGRLDPSALNDSDLWLNRGQPPAQAAGPAHPRIHIAGRVGDVELDSLYRSALCVVAPAYDEDDGLTVLEAMAHAKPVIVCRDGGGLLALVRDGVNGFVVDPDGASIAAAIETFAADPALARTMGKAARDSAAERSPQRARTQLLDAVDLVMSGGR